MEEQEETLVERPASPGVLLSSYRSTVETNCLLWSDIIFFVVVVKTSRYQP